LTTNRLKLKKEEKGGKKRTSKDYSLGFKLSLTFWVESEEFTYKQAPK
jgi:hypothetical protein